MRHKSSLSTFHAVPVRVVQSTQWLCRQTLHVYGATTGCLAGCACHSLAWLPGRLAFHGEPKLLVIGLSRSDGRADGRREEGGRRAKYGRRSSLMMVEHRAARFQGERQICRVGSFVIKVLSYRISWVLYIGDIFQLST